MRNLVQGTVFLSVAALVAACASSVPPNRLADYISQDMKSEADSLLTVEPRPLLAGLILVSDTAAPESIPNLPDEALTKLGEELTREIGRVLPVTIKEVISAEGIRPLDGNRGQFSDLAKRHGLDYLAVVVVSSTEQEYPMSVFLGWTTHNQPGYRRDNWSLLEFALLDVKSGHTLMQAEGRGWATLDRPAAPGIDQWYPVVYLRPQDPERHFWPPTYEGAPNTLRVVSFNQAEKRLTLKLQNLWLGQLEADAAARRHS
jgi:hypothetical protein